MSSQWQIEAHQGFLKNAEHIKICPNFNHDHQETPRVKIFPCKYLLTPTG